MTVWDERNQCEVKLLTNQLQFAASTIADIYRERWQIELFFKALKQNLKIKTFVGTSAESSSARRPGICADSNIARVGEGRVEKGLDESIHEDRITE